MCACEQVARQDRRRYRGPVGQSERARSQQDQRDRGEAIDAVFALLVDRMHSHPEQQSIDPWCIGSSTSVNGMVAAITYPRRRTRANSL